MKIMINNHRFKTLFGKTSIFCLVIFHAGDAISQNVGINQPNPQWPLDMEAPHGVLRITTTNSDFGSVVELRNLKTSAPYLGAINFNDSINLHPGQIGYLKNHQLTFRTNYAERVRIDQQGRVGIGIIPSFPLDVMSAQSVARLVSLTSVNGSVLELRNQMSTATYLGAVNFVDSLGFARGQIAYQKNNHLLFNTNSAERIRIDSIGRVGIGTSTPGWPVDVKAPHGVLRITTTDSDFGSVVELRNLKTSGPYLGAINFNDSINLHPGQIGYLKNHQLTFRTNYLERMRIDQQGRVGIGIIPSFPLDVYSSQGVLRLTSSSAVNGSVLELSNLYPQATYLGAINFNNLNGEFPGQIGYTTDDNMLFRVNGIERVRLDSFGNVGIGTQTPQYDLDISSNQAGVRINTTSDVIGSNLILRNTAASPTVLGSLLFTNSAGLYPAGIIALPSDQMLFKTFGEERMRINHLGYVGIGTQNPQKHLDISANTAAVARITSNSIVGSTLELRNVNVNDNTTGSIHFTDEFSDEFFIPALISYNGTHGFSIWANYAERLTIDPDGNVGLGTNEPVWPLDIEADYAVTRMVSTNSSVGAAIELKNSTNASSYLGVINFNNTSNGYPGQIAYLTDNQLLVSVNNAERMRINANGLMGVGRVPVTNKLEIEGNASKSSAGDWLANSDIRLKKNVESLNSKEMLDRLLLLKGIKYEWNDDKTGTTRPEGVQIGFTAQNIQEAFPTFVEEDSLGYLQTPYGTYDPIMVEAIRALDTEIKLLKAELERLNQQLLNTNSKNNEVAKQ